MTPSAMTMSHAKDCTLNSMPTTKMYIKSRDFICNSKKYYHSTRRVFITGSITTIQFKKD